MELGFLPSDCVSLNSAADRDETLVFLL